LSKLKIGEIFRTARPYSEKHDEIDGFRNHFSATFTKKQKLALMDSGINSIASVSAVDGDRIPAILIRSSPHKVGSQDTPWKDTFDVNNGHIHYFGDNKNPNLAGHETKGNKVLISALQSHSSVKSEVRNIAIPLIFYRSVTINNKKKGFIEFNGFGIIRGAQLVTQYCQKTKRSFSNYQYDFVIFSMADEGEIFDWDWISARRNSGLSLAETNRLAPKSWQRWLSHGEGVLDGCRRRVSRLYTLPSKAQQPTQGSEGALLLKQIYNFYYLKRSNFEALAALVTEKIIRDNGGNYATGWVTDAGRDGGADFYGRLDIGNGFGKAKIILLGQAKCEKLGTPTGGNHIARTVARLKRGWIGAYVTTSYFSPDVQQEVIEDAYPLLLVNGDILVKTIQKIMHEQGWHSLEDYLRWVDGEYARLRANRRPEELLLE
jgi:hypothetical protein|tara:strand:- start:3265 stop:4560 length:1296 start_codon:yes stop_codon:yes gene_type:complete